MSKKNQLTRTDYLPVDEYKRLVSSLHADNDVLGETYCRVAKATALRISDVLRLTWGMVLSERFSIREQKTGKMRNIDFSDNTIRTMKSLYRINGKPDLDTPVFYNNRLHKTYSKQHINQVMKKWKEKYKIKVGNFSSHSFRKSFGREYWEKNGKSEAALLKLGNIFNHSSIAVTKIYLGIRDEEISEAYKMIEV